MSYRRTVVVAAVALCAAQVARAQDLPTVCRGLMRPPVGAWSQFSVAGGRAAGATMRMSVVGSETRGDTTMLWLEFAARGMPLGLPDSSADTILIVNKLLVTGFGPGMAQPQAHVMKLGSAPAMTMPVGAGSPGAQPMQDCSDGKVLGWGSVTVPAGTFRALHVQDANGQSDAWIVPDLPFGLVKVAMASDPTDSGQMVLVGHGMDAKSQITEAPRPYDPQLLAQMLMGGKR